MEKGHINSRRAVRCKHCGGLMREYRGDINCLMCGRTLEHICERCRYTDEGHAEEKLLDRKVA